MATFSVLKDRLHNKTVKDTKVEGSGVTLYLEDGAEVTISADVSITWTEPKGEEHSNDGG
jgi:hypothetical protein